MIPFADACLASPVGATLLARLECRMRPDGQPWRIVDDPSSDPNLVAQAVQRVEEMTFGELCQEALEAGEDVGPWTASAEIRAWATLVEVESRRPIAAAIERRFGPELHAPIDLDHQYWWLHSDGATFRGVGRECWRNARAGFGVVVARRQTGSHLRDASPFRLV